jgi:hypothetical protein
VDESLEHEAAVNAAMTASDDRKMDLIVVVDDWKLGLFIVAI